MVQTILSLGERTQNEKKGISTHPCLPGSLLGLPLLWGRGGLILSTPTVGQLPDCPGAQMGLV